MSSKPRMNSGRGANHSDHPDQHEEKGGGTDGGSWEQGSGEGSASALKRMKHQQRNRSESTPSDEGPSSN